MPSDTNTDTTTTAQPDPTGNPFPQNPIVRCGTGSAAETTGTVDETPSTNEPAETE